MTDMVRLYGSVRRSIEAQLAPLRLTIKSGGTGRNDLLQALDPETGYWETPAAVSSKPPRLIVHFHLDNGAVQADLARGSDGTLLNGASTLTYVNNHDGKCVALAFRALAAFKMSDSSFRFPEWEWLVVLATAKPLPKGTSSETVSGFDPNEMTFSYGHEQSRKSYPIVFSAIVTAEEPGVAVTIQDRDVTYTEATDALAILFATASGDETEDEAGEAEDAA